MNNEIGQLSNDSQYISSEERERSENLISLKIREAYKDTLEYKNITKLVNANPNGNERKIIELIKKSREKISKMPWLFEGSSSTMTTTNRKLISNSYAEYLYLMKRWKENQSEIEKPFFEPNEPQTTGKLMLYHWALKKNLSQIMKQGLLPAALSGEGSGSGILNYGTLDMNNNWAGAGIGGLDGSANPDEYQLLQVDIGKSELLSWTYYINSDGGIIGGWNSSLFSSSALNPNGVEKMFHRFIRADQEALTANPMPDSIPDRQEDDFRYSYKFGKYIPGGFFNSSEEEEMMFWYAAPRRIKIVHRKLIDSNEENLFRRARRKWRKGVIEYQKQHPELLIDDSWKVD